MEEDEYDVVVGGKLKGLDESALEQIRLKKKAAKEAKRARKREKKRKRDKKEKKDKRERKGKEKGKRRRRESSSEEESEREERKRSRREEEKHKKESDVEEDGPSEDSGDEEEDDEELKGLTPAQRKFELARRKREKETIQKMISKTHREKIDEFNEKLAKLSEHHDIPRISAAGQG